MTTALAMSGAIERMKRNALEVFPDSDRYKCRHTIRSQTTNQKYMVSFDAAKGAGYWVCSCFGYRRAGHCKHLTASGLVQRADNCIDHETKQALGL